MTRRDLLAGATAVLGVGGLNAARSHITKTRISAITDEIGRTQSDAIAFAKQYGLQWVELRTVPETKKEFAFLTEPEVKRYAAELSANRLKVSLLKTSLLKFPWDSEAAQERWGRRKDDLSTALNAAQILGVDKIRVFTGTRAANPETAYPKIVQTMEELIPMAEKARVRLLIENEPSQNIGTAAELKAILEMLPSKSIGFNWDAQNALSLHETPWPDGYTRLPKSRMLHVQIKAEGLTDGAGKIDWKSILEAMQRDNYQGEIGLATEIFDNTFDRANDAMGEILHIVGRLE